MDDDLFAMKPRFSLSHLGMRRLLGVAIGVGFRELMLMSQISASDPDNDTDPDTSQPQDKLTNRNASTKLTGHGPLG